MKVSKHSIGSNQTQKREKGNWKNIILKLQKGVSSTYSSL